jgi:class 3 adenylate cyclase
VTVNEHLDYFGTTVGEAEQLPELAAAGEVVLTATVASDPQVAALLHSQGLRGSVIPADLSGTGEPVPCLVVSLATSTASRGEKELAGTRG